MSDDCVLIDHRGPVCWLRLNRPQQRNPLSREMIQSLHRALTDAANDPAVKVIVIASSGPVFSAGHDLKEMYIGADVGSEQHRAHIRDILNDCAAMMLNILHNPKPVIAAVQGTATAAGCQIVATCDLAIAAEGAKFCTPGVNIGSFCTTPLVAIGRNVHRKHAMELALTGDLFDAKDAIRMGLINKAVADEELEVAVSELANRIAEKSNQGIRLGKAAFYHQIDLPFDEALKTATDAMVEVLCQDDGYEGATAFFEKRPPKYT